VVSGKEKETSARKNTKDSAGKARMRNVAISQPSAAMLYDPSGPCGSRTANARANRAAAAKGVDRTGKRQGPVKSLKSAQDLCRGRTARPSSST